MLHIPYVAGGSVLLGALYNQLSGALVYGPLFGQVWLDAMNKDKGGDAWMSKEENKNQMPVLFVKEFFLNLGKAWVTGLLLNLTQARTMSQAAQLGAFLYFGVQVPSILSESMWEKRPCDLQKFKLLSGFSSTILLACLMHWWGTA
ncbi:hypothetical protein BGX29_002032 [Mortierella sp. GBA35]|nr:hypothetical protein BGX23_011167 [Mortierella sp. AD031]KAF9104348.1 hypothetical protein BGX29_002032 [Mortierella sp. GBA35]KAG0200809.1 hypothetical protein BGX33_010756 [Mortierella sp. NVP41]